MDIYQEALEAHHNLRGKLQIKSKVPLVSPKDLSIYYSPGVGAVADLLGKHPEKTPEYTSVNNTVAIISDGSAVLGLGNIGPYGALPVMEGKAILFKEFADIDAFPMVLNTQDPDEIIKTIINIAPSFGGINLEDIASPNCFYIENELKKRLDMPIMHDDQHGTAIVVLAGLINSCLVTNRKLSDCKIVISGSGAAGIAIAKLIYKYAKPRIIAVDSKGIIHKNRENLNTEKKMLLEMTDGFEGSLSDAIVEADIFIGVSKPKILTESMIKAMANNPIIFALGNPEPEILPELALKAGAAIVATGRSDYPNQVNNVLAFPGVFRGALDTRTKIDDAHKIAAAEAIARVVRVPRPDCVIPSPFDDRVVRVVSESFSH